MADKKGLKEKFSTGEKPTGADFAELIDGVEGPKGDTGPAGKDGTKGVKGDPGTAGKDGFGTEEQYNDLISRLEALEGAE